MVTSNVGFRAGSAAGCWIWVRGARTGRTGAGAGRASGATSHTGLGSAAGAAGAAEIRGGCSRTGSGARSGACAARARKSVFGPGRPRRRRSTWARSSCSSAVPLIRLGVKGAAGAASGLPGESAGSSPVSAVRGKDRGAAGRGATGAQAGAGAGASTWRWTASGDETSQAAGGLTGAGGIRLGPGRPRSRLSIRARRSPSPAGGACANPAAGSAPKTAGGALAGTVRSFRAGWERCEISDAFTAGDGWGVVKL